MTVGILNLVMCWIT